MGNKEEIPNADAATSAPGQQQTRTDDLILPYPEYYIIDVAFGGVTNRNNLISHRNLSGRLEKWQLDGGTKRELIDCYRSYWRYPDAMLEHFDKRRSVSGYAGSVYADYLPIDIDSQELIQSLQSARSLLYHLEQEYEVDLKAIKVYFSGSKGFHIELPSHLFGFEPSPLLHDIYKDIVTRLSPEGLTVDYAVYDKVRLWRIPNTINSKSGL